MTFTPLVPDDRGLWNADREDIRRALASRDQLCGELYRKAIDLMGSSQVDAATLVVAAHALRELINMLPEYLGDGDDAPRVVDEAASRDALVQAWKGANVQPREGAGGVEIPLSVVEAIRRFVEDQDQITENKRSRRSALVLGDRQRTDDATVLLVRQAMDAIERYRHPRGGTSRWSSLTFIKHVEVIERALQSRVGDFFAVAEQLTLLLRRANTTLSTDEGDWVAPTDEQVDEALSRLADQQHRRIFFAGLRNPNWLEALDQRRVFDDPPAQLINDEGYLAWTSWPQGEYLAAVADQEPAMVTSVLLRVVPSSAADNVRDVVIKSARRMPPSGASRLVALITSLMGRPLEPDAGLEVADVAVRLAAAGDVRPALKLANRLLRPRALPEETGSHWRSVTCGIEPDWYGEALGRVCNASPGVPLDQLAIWLEEEQRISGSFDPDKKQDYSFISRPAIDDHEQNTRSRDVQTALVETLRDQAVKSLLDGLPAREMMRVLTRGGIPLLERIGLYALQQALSQDVECLVMAKEIVLDPEILDNGSLHREYCHLAREVLPRLTDHEFRSWAALVESRPEITPIRRAHIADRNEGQPLEDAISAYREVWLHQQLSAVGRDALRGELSARLDELDARRGTMLHPDFLSWHSNVRWEGDEPSPIPESDFAGRSAAEVIGALETWTPDPDAVGVDPVSRLASMFGRVVAKRGAEFTAHTAGVLSLGEPWISRFLDGTREAVSSGQAVDWDTFIEDISLFAPYIDSRPLERKRYLRQVICKIFEGGATRTEAGIPSHLATSAVDVLLGYFDDPDPAASSLDEKPDWSDPITASLNTVRPCAIRAAVRLAWVHRTSNDVSGSLIDSVLERASGRLAPDRDPSLAVAATFGELLMILQDLSPDWLERHRAQLLSDDAFGDVVATTALYSFQTSNQLLETLESKIESLIDRSGSGQTIVSGLNSADPPVQHLGTHLMLLVLWGVYELETPILSRFFEKVPVAIRARTLGEVGHLLSGSESVIPKELSDRAKALWDSRAELVRASIVDPVELSLFSSWVECDVFEPDWWLPRLKEAVERARARGRSSLAQRLATASKAFPREAVQTLALLLNDDRRGFGRYSLVDASPTIIARAVRSSDVMAVECGQKLLDRLGREGYLDLAALVADFDEAEGDAQHMEE